MSKNSTSNSSIQATSKWGAFLALACAVHCIAMPFVATLLPVLGLQFLESTAFELSIVGLGLGFGAYSVGKGYLRVHRNKNILGLFAIGAAVMLTGILGAEEPLEIWLVVVGAIAVGAAQWINVRHSHSVAHSNGTCSHAVVAE